MHLEVKFESSCFPTDEVQNVLASRLSVRRSAFTDAPLVLSFQIGQCVSGDDLVPEFADQAARAWVKHFKRLKQPRNFFINKRVNRMHAEQPKRSKSFRRFPAKALFECIRELAPLIE